MTLDQIYDELYGEIDQIKNELKNTLAQIQYASNFTEGISLGTLSVGSESSQVIAPHVALLPGAESGMMLLDLPVGTESAMLPVQIQDDPEATELAGDAIPTGKTMESYLNSKIVAFNKTVTIPGGAGDTPASFDVNISKYTGGKTVKGCVATLGNYPLPYISGGNVLTYVDYPLSSANLRILNKSTTWSNYNLNVVLFF